ncbi:hypothetical protein BMW23_1099 [Bodo saltans virus]|uniref:Uncharacterized protein n=1 Tax=Bodo saltans virus TaxID=2024608 RepID=A0A2H4UW32_9VIRU|nr:hypothetical protein QJ851_gp1080 [Bodo saltans virus]ATZ81143.1 hypothetical protein BMW23_1099 [Bodo saltans virus]
MRKINCIVSTNTQFFKHYCCKTEQLYNAKYDLQHCIYHTKDLVTNLRYAKEFNKKVNPNVFYTALRNIHNISLEVEKCNVLDSESIQDFREQLNHQQKILNDLKKHIIEQQ